MGGGDGNVRGERRVRGKEEKGGGKEWREEGEKGKGRTASGYVTIFLY